MKEEEEGRKGRGAFFDCYCVFELIFAPFVFSFTISFAGKCDMEICFLFYMKKTLFATLSLNFAHTLLLKFCISNNSAREGGG